MGGATRGGAVSGMMVEEDSDGLRELDEVAAVVGAEARELSLQREVMLSEALLERRRWKGLKCAREAMELRRFMEVRLESEDGATSLERDLRDGMLLPFGLSVTEDDGCGVCFVSWKRGRFCLRRTAAGSAITPASSREERPGELPRTCLPCSGHTNLRKNKGLQYIGIRRKLKTFRLSDSYYNSSHVSCHWIITYIAIVSKPISSV
jgi:hypothetical protein